MQKPRAPARGEVKLPLHVLQWKSLRALGVWAATYAEVRSACWVITLGTSPWLKQMVYIRGLWVIFRKGHRGQSM